MKRQVILGELETLCIIVILAALIGFALPDLVVWLGG